MPTHDYDIANQSGQAFRIDLNNALSAIVSNNSNSSEPATKYAYQWWADTSNSVLKIRNSSNNGWITLFTLAGGVDVDAASNFNEDVTFTGASANIVFDKSDSALEFADDAKATFGTGADLSIFHDQTNSIIKNDTGQLSLRGNDIRLLNNGASTALIKAFNAGAVELYNDGDKKFQTTAAGVDILGQTQVSTEANARVPVIINDSSNTSTLTHRMSIRTGGTEVGSIKSTNTATQFIQSGSDITLKKNFEDWTENTLDLFKNINPKKFHFIQEEDTAEKSKGFIAQEMVESFPEAYTKEDKEDSKYYFNPSGMVVYLMKAIQELEAKVVALESA